MASQSIWLKLLVMQDLSLPKLEKPMDQLILLKFNCKKMLIRQTLNLKMTVPLISLAKRSLLTSSSKILKTMPTSQTSMLATHLKKLELCLTLDPQIHGFSTKKLHSVVAKPSSSAMMRQPLQPIKKPTKRLTSPSDLVPLWATLLLMT